MKIKKTLITILAAYIIAVFAPCTVFAEGEPSGEPNGAPIEYYEYYNEETQGFETTLIPESAIRFSTLGAVEEIGIDAQYTCYVLDCDYINGTSSIRIKGDVSLILMDGCRMEVFAVRVDDPNTVRIYAQENGTGTLIADNGNHFYNNEPGCAGIGGSGFYSDGSGDVSFITGGIYIYGGQITAKGGPGAAGIGGSGRQDENAAASNITIRGGKITAIGGTGTTGGTGAGIGGGIDGYVNNITISGGTIEAQSVQSNNSSWEGSAAIGSGGTENFGGAFEKITISGGNITATSSGCGAAIGGGYKTDDGARIITITGGIITANADVNRLGWPQECAAGIGGGYGSKDITVNIGGTDTEIVAIGGGDISIGIPNETANISIDSDFLCYVGDEINNLTASTTPVTAVSSNKVSRLLKQSSLTIAYSDANGNGQMHRGYQALVAETPLDKLCNWNEGNNSTKWYVLQGEVDMPGAINVSGDMTLVLADDSKLKTSYGIKVNENSSLTIFGQTDQTGKIIASSSNSSIIEVNQGTLTINSGIVEARSYTGSEEYDSNKNNSTGILIGNNNSHVYINGGDVTATGGAFGAGIGGALEKDSTSSIVINGGTVRAAAPGAGIGGSDGHHGVNIFINGGVVEAGSSSLGAGIGGGDGGDGYNITITGGKITATGSNVSSGAQGAGIGGGRRGNGENIRITGGDIYAAGGRQGAGIGGGCRGNAKSVTIEGGTVHAIGRNGAAGIGGGNTLNSTTGGADYISITGGSVLAEAERSGSGIGSGGLQGSASNINISGGKIKAHGRSAIGKNISNFTIGLDNTLLVGSSEKHAIESNYVERDEEKYRTAVQTIAASGEEIWALINYESLYSEGSVAGEDTNPNGQQTNEQQTNGQQTGGQQIVEKVSNSPTQASGSAENVNTGGQQTNEGESNPSEQTDDIDENKYMDDLQLSEKPTALDEKKSTDDENGNKKICPIIPIIVLIIIVILSAIAIEIARKKGIRFWQR